MKYTKIKNAAMHISKEVKIALIAIFILLISIWGYNFLKGKNILKPKQEYYIVFDRIDGLIESGIVSYKGYKVGNIAKIDYDSEKSGKFILMISLEEKIHIPLNSVIRIKSTSPIVASNELELVFSDSKEFHHPGDTLLSEGRKGISDILEPLQKKVNSVLDGIDSLAASINNVLTTGAEANLRNTLASLDASLASLKTALGPSGSLTRTFNSLETVSKSLEEKSPQLASGIEHLANVTSDLDSAGLDKTIRSLDSTLISLNAVLAKIDSGNGTMGKLVNDSALYVHLDSTTYHLDELMKDLKAHPKRYVHFSVFGKKD
jgi:phospholipid/cholesterol/gamma-HCH transport system substrate-binding protein